MPISSKGNLFLISFILLLSLSSSSHYLVHGSPVPYKHIYNRPDPFSHHFKSYHGSYNITDIHYWSSAAFTGVHGYAMACIWILGGLGLGVYILVRNLSCTTSSPSSAIAIRRPSDFYRFIPLVVVVLCTFLAIVASGVVLVENHKSLLKIKKLEHTIFRLAIDTRRTIRRVTRAMYKLRHLLYPYNKAACTQLRLASGKLRNESKVIQRMVYRHKHTIDSANKIWYGATAGIVSVNLVLIVAAVVLLLLHWWPGFLMMIFLCWILTALCWILTGVHFFIHTFAKDTCSAFEEFQQNPGNNSLSNVLPCVDPMYADQIMSEIGSTIYKFINKVNSKIANLGGILRLDEQGENAFGGFSKICNPFSNAPNYSYCPGSCPEDAIPISNIPDVLQRFTCYKDNSTASCSVGRKFISEASYDMATAYTQTIQEVVNILPDVENLTRCSLVKETISDVLLHQCRPFRISFKFSWLSIISLSTIMVILELAWLAKVYQNNGRSFCRCSVIPRV